MVKDNEETHTIERKKPERFEWVRLTRKLLTQKHEVSHRILYDNLTLEEIIKLRKIIHGAQYHGERAKDKRYREMTREILDSEAEGGM